MTNATLQKKILNIEVELKSVRSKLSQRNTPNLEMDEKNWSSVSKTVKSVRKDIFNRTYGKKKSTAR